MGWRAGILQHVLTFSLASHEEVDDLRTSLSTNPIADSHLSNVATVFALGSVGSTGGRIGHHDGFAATILHTVIALTIGEEDDVTDFGIGASHERLVGKLGDRESSTKRSRSKIETVKSEHAIVISRLAKEQSRGHILIEKIVSHRGVKDLQKFSIVFDSAILEDDIVFAGEKVNFARDVDLLAEHRQRDGLLDRRLTLAIHRTRPVDHHGQSVVLAIGTLLGLEEDVLGQLVVDEFVHIEPTRLGDLSTTGDVCSLLTGESHRHSVDSRTKISSRVGQLFDLSLADVSTGNRIGENACESRRQEEQPRR